MPQDPNTVNTVLQDYVATRNAKPNLTQAELFNKFPEINTFAQEKGVTANEVATNLEAYYTDFNSGNFQDINQLNAKHSFFFGEPTTTTSTTETVTPTTGQQEQSPVDQTQYEMNSSTLQDYIATRDAKPDLTSAELYDKFPEVTSFAQKKGVGAEEVLKNLESYYQDFRSGEFQSIDELNAKHSFFFETPEEVKKKEVPSELVVTNMDTFLSPDVPDSNAFLTQSPEDQNEEINKVIDQKYTGIPGDKVSFETYEAMSSGEVPNFIARMYEPTISVENEDGSTSTHLMSYGETDGKYYVFPTLFDKDGQPYFPEEDGIDPFDYALQIGNIKEMPDEESAKRFAEGEWKKVIDGYNGVKNVKPTRRDQINFQYRMLVAKNVGDWTGNLSVDEFRQLNSDFYKEAADFWNNLTPGERRNLIIDQQRRADQITQERRSDAADNMIDDLVPIYSKRFNVPEDQVRESLPELAMQMEIQDPDGDNFFISDEREFESNYSKSGQGSWVYLTDVRTQLANEYNAKIGENAKQSRYQEILNENGGDNTAAQIQFNQEQDDRGLAFTPESDLEIVTLKEEIYELENKPDRTAKDNLALKKKRDELKEMQEEGRVGEDLFDPKTGTFVSGNTKDQEIIDFNEELQKNMARYSNTDLGTLRKLRDDKWFQFQSYVEDVVLNTYPDDLAPIEHESLQINAGIYDKEDPRNERGQPFPEDFMRKQAVYAYDAGFTGYRDFFLGRVGGEANDESEVFKIINSGYWSDDVKNRANNLLADYMAVNRMITLNEDPGTVVETGSGVPEFFRDVGKGFKEAMGVPSTATVEVNRIAVNELEGLGYNLTGDQKNKLDRGLSEQVGQAVGGSIPIMVEIGTNIFIGNKLAGVAKIPKIFQAIAGSNKAAKFGLTLLYDSAIQGGAFALAGEDFEAGVGEGFAQAISSAIMNRFGVKNKFLKFTGRWVGGAVGETAAEYSGQFLDELENTGWDWQRATEETFGKTAEDQIEKLAVTYFTALTLGVGGAGAGSSEFLFDAQKELKNSGSNSPIVKAALEYDVTTPVTPEERTRNDEIMSKVENGETLTDEEIMFTQLVAGKDEYQQSKESGESEELAPVVNKDEEGDTEYKIDGKFYSEEEMIGKLEDETFQESVKNGEVEVELNNPSEAVEEKVSEGFVTYAEAKAESEIAGAEAEQTAEDAATGQLEFDFGEETKIQKDDRTDEQGVSGEKQVGQESVGRQPDQITGEQETTTGGVLQEEAQPEEVVEGEKPAAEKKKFVLTPDNTEELPNASTEDITENLEGVNDQLANEKNLKPADQDAGVIANLEKSKDLLEEELNKRETDESVQTEDQAETKAKTEESLNNVAAEFEATTEGVNPVSTPKGFDSVINFATDLVKETGLKGKALITEMKSRMKEKLGDAFDETTIDEVSGEINDAVKDVEQIAAPEAEPTKAEPAAKKPKKIAEGADKIADKILSFKVPPGLDKLQSSPKPIIDAAWNTAITATAETIRAGGKVVQAVSDGIAALRETEWYQSLSDKGKRQAEAIIKSNLTKSVKEGKKVAKETEGKMAEGWTSGEEVNATNDKGEIEAFIEKHKEAIVKHYTTEHSQGKKGVIDPDAIREYLHELGYDGKNVPDFAASGHILTEAIFEHLLSTVKNKKMGILSGVGGSGKSRAVRSGKVSVSDKGIVFDSAFNWSDDIIETVQKAIDAGFEVELFPVYNDFSTAFNNTLGRGKRTGRFLSLNYFLASFGVNQGKIQRVLDAHPNLKVTPVDNSGNQTKSVSVEDSKNWNYKPSDQEVSDLLKQIADDTELTNDQLASIAAGLEGVRQNVSEWTSEMERSLNRIEERLQQTDGGDKSGEVQKRTPKKPKKRVRREVRVEPGEKKLNPKNKRVAERIAQQSDLRQETKDAILEKSKNKPRNQKDLIKGTKKAFDQIMEETDGSYEEVIKIADNPEIDPDVREALYGHVMQHLATLEQSKDPAISKAASNRLVELGIIVAERLNQAGKQIKVMHTIYSEFPMYALYSAVSRVETFADRHNGKKRKPGTTKKEATEQINNVIDDMIANLDQIMKDPELSAKMEKIRKKLEGRPVRPKKLSNKKKQEIKNKRKDILKKRFGMGDTLKSGIPGGDQLIGIVELAATFIEEGYYRSADIVAAVYDTLTSAGMKYDKKQIKEALKTFDEFNQILDSEKVTTKKDSFGDTIAEAVTQYLKDGLEYANMTMKEALTASDQTKDQLRKTLIENIKNDFELTDQEAQTVVDMIDQIFRDRAMKELKKSMDKFYPKISVKGAIRKKEIDRFVDDISLGAFDATMEFMNMTFKKYGMINSNNPELIKKLKELSNKMRNAPDGVLKDRHRKALETLIHKETGGYGLADWFMTRFYGSILSGPKTHLKNLKYNVVAIGIAGPLSQIYQKGANPIRTWKTMIKQFYQVDRKVAAHYIKTGDNFIDPGLGPKTFADQLKFNLLKNGFTKLLNVTSTRFLVASDLVMTRPFAAAVFKNHVKAWLRETEGLKGKALEKRALEVMGYTEENVEKSTKEAIQDVKDDYGFDPFDENADLTDSVRREAAVLLLLRTQERILENSGVEEQMGTDNWFDKWNGESLQESSTTEAKNLALQGEVTGVVGIISDLMERLTDKVPAVKFKVPFVRILGNMLNMGIKWTPGLGQLQALTRYTLNRNLSKKGMPTVSSTTIWALDKFVSGRKVKLFKEGFMMGFNKESSYRQSKRDLRNAFFTLGVQSLIFALMAKDDEDEGLVITGQLDKSFFLRGSVEKGTGTQAYGVYWRDGDGSMSLISNYKNSAYGFALSFFGGLSDNTINGEDGAARSFINAWFSSPFYIADKPAATSLKEMWDELSPTDKYGRNKWLDDVGYKDQAEISLAKFINSAFVPNLFKQSNSIGEDVYGMEKKRATNWWQSLVKGMPWANQNLLDTQVDHFGEPIEGKMDFGFLGLKGNIEDGFTILEPDEIDPYYEVYTDHGMTPKWFTDKEIPVYQKVEVPKETLEVFPDFEKWEKSKIEQPDGTETGKIRITKYEAHVLNALIGQYRKDGMDNYAEYSVDDQGNVVEKKGITALKELDNAEFKKAIQKIDRESKEKAYIEFYKNYYGDDIEISNQEKGTSYLKVK